MDDEVGLTPRQQEALKRNPEAELPVADTELRGVEGWLSFLAVSLVALGPMLTVVMTFVQNNTAKTLYPSIVGTELWEKALVIDWLSVIAYCAISIFAGVRLLKYHVVSTVWIVIFCIWIAGPGIAIFGLFAADYLTPGGATASAAGSSLGRTFIYSIIWTIYLLRSKRVKNTYLREFRVDSTSRWRALSRTKRQYAFFAISWIIVSFLYFQLISPLVTYPEDADLQRMWAIIILPPFLLAVGWWVYARFVGMGDESA